MELRPAFKRYFIKPLASRCGWFFQHSRGPQCSMACLNFMMETHLAVCIVAGSMKYLICALIFATSFTCATSYGQAPVRVEKDVEYLESGRAEKADLYLPTVPKEQR